nr:MAG TPA: hypothetical protein [Caudoviricetes sp.]
MYNLNRYPCGAFRTPKGYEFLSPYMTMCGFYRFRNSKTHKGR